MGLKGEKIGDGKYKYKMVGVYPKDGEKEYWERHKGKLTLLDFIREAVNAYIEGIKPNKAVLSDTKEVEELKEENRKLSKENKELKRQVEKLEQDLSLLREAYGSKSEDWLDKILAVIPTDRYKKLKDVLLDAGLAKEWSTELEWFEAQQQLYEELKDLL